MATTNPNELNQRYDHELEEYFQYNSETLVYLRTKLDEFDLACLQLVQKESELRGLRKTHLEDYRTKRKQYDAAFVRLEAQGLIRIIPDGTFRPFFITIRGKQILKL